MYVNWGRTWEKEQTINSSMVSLNVSAYCSTVVQMMHFEMTFEILSFKSGDPRLWLCNNVTQF